LPIKLTTERVGGNIFKNRNIGFVELSLQNQWGEVHTIDY